MDRVWNNGLLSFTKKTLNIQLPCISCASIWFGDLDTTEGGQPDFTGLPYALWWPALESAKVTHHVFGLSLCAYVRILVIMTTSES